MSIKKYLRKNVYRWHRVTSLIIAVPVLLWALSGCLHPIMSTLKPNVSNRALPPAGINSNGIALSLKQALAQHQIEKINRFRIVQLNDRYYYQVSQAGLDTLTYIACDNGAILSDGARIYAADLAKRIIKEPVKASMHSHGRSTGLKLMNAAVDISHHRKETPSVKMVELITSFNSAYKRSNVFLPVYRVSFNRGDSITLYVDPSGDRLAYAADARQLWFSRFFAITHTWSFLDGLGRWKTVALGCFSALCFLSSVFGFYVYNMVNKKKAKPSGARNTNRAWHRAAGNFFLVTTLLFSFSGAWHSFMKISKNGINISDVNLPVISCHELDFSIPEVMNTLSAGEMLCGVSAVKMEGNLFLQLSVRDENAYKERYLNVRTYELLPEGDKQFANWLACAFADKTEASIVSARQVTAFNHDYNMMYKRLPVVEVSFQGNEKYYIETSTGCLSAVTNGSSRAERFSFSNLHMHHFWKMWLGKEIGEPVRNAVLIISTSGLFLLALTGMLMYFNKLRRRRET